MCNRTMLATCVVIMAATAYGSPTDPSGPADAADANRVNATDMMMEQDESFPIADDAVDIRQRRLVLSENLTVDE